MKARHNAIQVEYKDKENNYETAIEYVSDDEAIRKYGLNLKKVQAFGCTSRGQAYRTGRWILETERLETETITFTVGAEGLMHLPGDIIKVADNYYAGSDIGGRIVRAEGRYITLDREITKRLNSVLSIYDINGKFHHLRIISVDGRKVILASIPPTGVEAGTVWTLADVLVSAKLYRAMSVAENEDGSYTITALQHEPQKEAIVDNGATFEPLNATLHQLPKIEHLDVSVKAGNAGISWQTGTGSAIVTYDVKILKESRLYALYKGLKTTELDLSDLPNGEYEIVIISRNASGQVIDEKSKTFTIDRPPQPTDVQVQGGLTDVIISWSLVDEFTQTEIWASEQDDLRTAKRVAKVTANLYTHSVGSRQVRFYWVRHARGQNLGAWYQDLGLRAETAANIAEELAVLHEKLKAPLAQEVLETALPARQLELVKTVATLDVPTQKQGTNLLFNQADGKLYRWNGSRYSAEIPMADLNGVVPRSQLDRAVLAELSSATAAIGQERTERNQAINAESAKQSQALQAEAQARGTAVNSLKQEDSRLAGLITTVTAKAEQALSGLTAEQNARADGDKAEAQARQALTTRVGSAESNITALQRTQTEQGRTLSESSERLNARIANVASEITAYKQAQTTKEQAQAGQISTISAKLGTVESQISSTSQTISQLNGTVSALHTIKAQAVANGRTAIAGIALGANEKESSVIVMADKFSVVKNAQDGNPTSLFSVQNNQVAINGNLVANGSITAEKLATNSVQTAHLSAGAIRTEHLAAGQVTADRLAIGLGGNLLYNPIFANNADGWTRWEDSNMIVTPNSGVEINRKTGLWQGNEYLPAENQYRWQTSVRSQTVQTRFGGIYQDVNLIQGQWYILSGFVASHRGVVGVDIEPQGNLTIGNISRNYTGNGVAANYNNGLVHTRRIWIKFKALNNGTARCLFNQYADPRQTGMFTVLRRPMLEECTEHTAEPSPWQNAGVTSIHGGSIKTRTITAEQIAANTITGNEIVAGTIATQHLAAGSVTADRLAARSVTADKMQVTSLSAVSSNLGNITAGSININNRFKVNAQGQVEMRSASNNVGLVINNEQIIVYDQNGRVRIKIGKLT